MIAGIFYPTFILTITILACFIWKKKLFGGFAPTPSPKHCPGSPGVLTAPPKLPAAIAFGLAKNWCTHIFSVLSPDLKWLNWCHFYFSGRFTHYSHRIHYFSVTIPRYHKDVYVNSFFSCKTWHWNSLPMECFPLTYDLTGFQSRIKRHILTVSSF